ncbi:hypothetical protein [Miltoncostaea marina]|uniref:hypothetical protein n=1 Tax=Miltoncostaea marina TaxID=2843215 RepID=UPI001C3E73A7|nr:hypothetical protein [Miltoncostaea marina]
MARPIDLDAYRDAAERYLTGAPPPSGLADELFDPDAVRALEAALATAGDRRRARALARFAAEGHLRAAGAAELAEAERLLAEPIVDGPSGPVAPREVDALLAAEPDAERRADLQAARLRALGARLAGPLEEAATRREAAARALGAASARELLARVAGVDLAAAAADGRRWLERTADAWALAREIAALESLGVRGDELTAADIPRLARAPAREADLPPDGGHAALAATLDLLGLPYARAVAPRAPGLAGYAEALRAGGASLARLGASTRLPVEARLLGDPALRWAHGFLLEGLVAEPAWLVRVAGLADPEPPPRAAEAVLLLGRRAAAGRAAALEGGGDPVSEAFGVQWPEELRLAEPLAGLAPADELRARRLAAALRAHLREAHGVRWFADPRAGSFLRELWLEGGDLDAGALIAELAPDADAA